MAEIEDTSVILEMDVLKESMNGRLRENLPQGDGSLRPRPKIMRVPEATRRGNHAAYTPKFISIGPFHRNIPEVQRAEQLKWRYPNDLVKRNPETNSVGKYIDVVRDRLGEARNHYSEEFRNMPDDEFVKMLVLDGSFILEFLIKDYSGKLETDVWLNLPLLRHDLLLLENQIPFFILKLLSGSTDDQADHQSNKLLEDIVQMYLIGGMKRQAEIQTPTAGNPGSDIDNNNYRVDLGGVDKNHLLDLHYQYQVEAVGQCENEDNPPCACLGNILTRSNLNYFCCCMCGSLWFVASGFHFFFIPILYFLFIGLWNVGVGGSTLPRAIPNARKLKEAGVELRKKTQQSGWESYLDVRFNRKAKVLEMPMLSLEESTLSSLRNLIAFENCYYVQEEDKKYHTNYVLFMSQMMKTAKDVEILEEYGIIQNKVGSGEDVVKLFRDLIPLAACVDEKKSYLWVRALEQIHSHMQVRCNRWRAALMHHYFHSPWAVVSSAAGFIALAISSAQLMISVYR